MGNTFLCGHPLNPCSPIIPPPRPVAATLPPTAAIAQKKSSKKLPLWAIITIAVGGGVVVVLFGIVLYLCLLSKRRRNGSESASESESESESETVVGKGKSSHGQRSEKLKEDFGSEVEGTNQNNKVVFFEGCLYSFDVEDLLRASAEVLGKGSFGTSYKATLEDSVSIVVKRLKDVVAGKKEFEQHMEIVERVDPHTNVVPLRAYYYSNDEELLVYDYISSGSLLNLLHGNRGAG